MDSRRNVLVSYALSLTIGMSFAAALIVPFLNENGLGQGRIMLLQTIFSFSAVALEVPTGYVADRFSRAASLRWGTLAVAAGLLGYSFANGFWQFVIFEVVEAFGFALLSGAHEALVYDSLKQDGRSGHYRQYSANVLTLLFGSTAVAAPFGSILASHVGIRPVLFLDGSLALLGFGSTLLLREPPRQQADTYLRHPLRDMAEVVRYCVRGHSQLPWLILLASSLSAVTYFGFWLAPAYYTDVGISLAWFGTILAARSGVKAVLSQAQKRVSKKWTDRRQLVSYCALSVLVYLGLACLRQPWAIALMLGFDVIQCLHGPIVSERMHQLTPSGIRAQVLSVASLCRRAMYGLLGPVFGFAIDRSVGAGMLLCAGVFAVLCFGSLWQLDRKGGL